MDIVNKKSVHDSYDIQREGKFSHNFAKTTMAITQPARKTITNRLRGRSCKFILNYQ